MMTKQKIDIMNYMSDWMDKVFEDEIAYYGAEMFEPIEEAERDEPFDLLALE